MGSIFQEHCYSSSVEALAAMCSVTYPKATSDGSGQPVLHTCAPGDGAIAVTSSSSAASATTSFPVLFPTCDPMEQYTDLAGLWAVGIGVLAIIAITRLSVSFLWENN